MCQELEVCLSVQKCCFQLTSGVSGGTPYLFWTLRAHSSMMKCNLFASLRNHPVHRATIFECIFPVLIPELIFYRFMDDFGINFDVIFNDFYIRFAQLFRASMLH